MIKKFLLWLLSVFLTISTGYYLLSKYLFNNQNSFTYLVDSIISIIGKILNFLAQHIFSVLIVVALTITLIFIYKIIVYKNSGDKE